MKAARARIFAEGVGECAVSSATFCLMAGEGLRRLSSRPSYHAPISVHFWKPRLEPPGGIKATIIKPATPCQGGMEYSCLISGISLSCHCHWLLPIEAG